MSDVAQIDQNDRPTLIAYNETTGLTETVRIDPILDAILVFGVADNGQTYTTLDHAKIDANDNSTMLGWNETTSLVEALRCGDGGELLITE